MPENSMIDGNALATLGGAILAVVVITNTLRHVFNWGPRWFALILSVVTSFVAASIQGFDFGGAELVKNIFLIILNGCLIYTSAFGIQNNVISPVPPPVAPPIPPVDPKAGTSDLEGLGTPTIPSIAPPKMDYRTAW